MPPSLGNEDDISSRSSIIRSLFNYNDTFSREYYDDKWLEILKKIYSKEENQFFMDSAYGDGYEKFGLYTTIYKGDISLFNGIPHIMFNQKI